MPAGGLVKQPRVRESVWERVQKQKEKILAKLRNQQKPVLDNKIDEMLKHVEVKKKVIVTFFRGVGKSIGRGLGSALCRAGHSISSLLGRKKLF